MEESIKLDDDIKKFLQRNGSLGRPTTAHPYVWIIARDQSRPDLANQSSRFVTPRVQ